MTQRVSKKSMPGRNTVSGILNSRGFLRYWIRGILYSNSCERDIGIVMVWMHNLWNPRRTWKKEEQWIVTPVSSLNKLLSLAPSYRPCSFPIHRTAATTTAWICGTHAQWLGVCNSRIGSSWDTTHSPVNFVVIPLRSWPMKWISPVIVKLNNIRSFPSLYRGFADTRVETAIWWWRYSYLRVTFPLRRMLQFFLEISWSSNIPGMKRSS